MLERAESAARGFLRRVPLARRLFRWWRQPDLAAIERRQARDTKLAVMQPWTTTAEDRYPALFDRLAELMVSVDAPRVLSFGCAGGEEVRALRQRLPDAVLIGIDVNPRAIARARRADRHARSDYRVADRPPPGEAFDAVLALAVFRHGALERDRRETCTDVLPFATAADCFARLDAVLKPGGVLAWGHAHVRLADLPGAERYTLIETFEELEPSTWLYGPDDRRIEGATAAGGLFRKRS